MHPGKELPLASQDDPKHRSAVPDSLQPITEVSHYDNVRHLWEDVVTGSIQAPFLRSLLDYLQERGQGLRVLELGCGAGDGLEYLTRLPQPRAPLAGAEARLIPDTFLQAYHGLERNADLLARGRERFTGDSRVTFSRWDVAAGLGDSGEEPYDLYLAGYGAFSALDWGGARRVLEEIARHAGSRALVVMDWLGRFSYEWQPRWTRAADGPAVLEVASETGQGKPLDSLPLHLAARQDVEPLVEDTSREERIFMRIASVTDRGIFLGRFSDRSLSYKSGRTIRRLVNQLWEPGRRTPLEELLIHYTPREGFGGINAFFLDYAASWNAVVSGARQIFRETEDSPGMEAVPVTFQGAVERAQARIRAATRLSLEMEVGDPRADFLEPQLASALRDLELELQKGLGCGAGLMIIAEVRKQESRR